MWAVITWPFLSFTRKVVLGRAWMTSPSIWIASSLDMAPIQPHGGRGLEQEAHRSDNSARSARDRGQAATCAAKVGQLRVHERRSERVVAMVLTPVWPRQMNSPDARQPPAVLAAR